MSNTRTKLALFDYQRVELLDSDHQRQREATRDYYLAIPDDDILKGFREQAGMPASGEHLGGWCAKDSGIVFGQWLSGMARLSKATGDAELRAKALRLMRGWAETMASLRPMHYVFDKYVGGLLDMAIYADAPEALDLLAPLTEWGIANLSRLRMPATDEDSQGGYFTGDMEWYTLAEQQYRAYALTGDEKYKTFGDVWLYPHYWDMFTSDGPPAPYGFHGNSHVNSLSSAAMAYLVTGDRHYLDVIVSAYDYFQDTQCYATGGYGPGEKLMRPNGELGDSIANEPNKRFLNYTVGRSFETPCGSWAVFKLVEYLMQFTGEARFGDWMEQLLYNGIGAAPPLAPKGRTFYYADYRLMGGSKIYFREPFPCCAGTYLQNVAEYANMIYLHSQDGLYVNLYVPSEVTWTCGGQEVSVVQQTGYPDEGVITLGLDMQAPASFALSFRIPGWAEGARLDVNGVPFSATCEPGTWATVDRAWVPGDRVTLDIPLALRQEPIDAQHPHRIAILRGPDVLVRTAEETVVPRVANVASWVSETDEPLVYAIDTIGTRGSLRPFRKVPHGVPYRMYMDVADA